MPALKIKAEKYGEAIWLLLTRVGGPFATRFEDTLIVNAQQQQALEEAGYVESNGSDTEAESKNGKKKS